MPKIYINSFIMFMDKSNLKKKYADSNMTNVLIIIIIIITIIKKSICNN